MYARAVDQAGQQLRELRHEERGALGLAAAALGAAIVATEIQPGLAGPLFVGGLFVGVIGVRAIWRRWDLVERLAGDRDAYVIQEVRDYASREATMSRRKSFAALVRARLGEARAANDTRVLTVAPELEALAAELEDVHLMLEPAAAVACMRLLSDVCRSPLLNPALGTEDLRSRVCQVRSGFAPRARPQLEAPYGGAPQLSPRL